MNRIDELIKKLCPNGVEYRPIWSLTAWDKKFNGVDKEKQKKVISYKYYLSTDFIKVEKKNGNIKYISTGISGDDRYTTEELAGDYIADGEVVCIPWGGTPNVKYHKGKFVTGDNRIATSLDVNILSNKFLYYWMQSKINVISKFYRGSGIKHPSMKDVLDMNIAVPPLEIQCEIVHILDDFTLLSAELSAELKARQKQYQYYFDYFYALENKENLDGKIYQLDELGELIRGKRFVHADAVSENGIPAIHYGELYTYYGVIATETKSQIRKDIPKKLRYAKKGDIVIVGAGENNIDIGVGVAWLGDYEVAVHDACYIFHPSEKVLSKYISFYLRADMYHQQIKKYVSEGKICAISAQGIGKSKIYVPSIEEQKRVIKILENFDKLNKDIRSGIPAEIEARQKQYEYYRDKLLTFKELKVNE